MKKRLILPALCTFIKLLVLYITQTLNCLIHLLQLSVYKWTNSVRRHMKLKLKTVLHKIVNATIKVWKPLDDLDLRFSFFLDRKRENSSPQMTDDLYFIEYWYHLVKTCSDNNPGWLYEPTRLYHYPTLQRKKCMDQPKDPAKEKKNNKKKKKKKLGGGGGSIFANPPSENPLVDEPS